MRKLLIGFVLAGLVAVQSLLAQVHFTGSVGFKSFGLEGAVTASAGGMVQSVGVLDCGKTGFAFGVGGGFTLVPAGVYQLDMDLEVSMAFANFLEAGYESYWGNGMFAADGYSGGSATIISFDIMPVHRINIPGFSLISPYAGVGLGLNLFSNSDVTFGPPEWTRTGTAKGNSEFQVGLLIFYGASFHFVGPIEPFVQLKHYIPFGSEYTFVKDPQTLGTWTIKDAPGYFNMSAGVRLVL
jgi:hypothetical protein